MNRILAIGVAFLVAGAQSFARDEYLQPPDSVVSLVDAPPPPELSVAPGGLFALVLEPAALPSIADVARPTLGLAGVVVDPAARARYRASFHGSMRVRDLRTGAEQPVTVADGARIGSATWSHNGRSFAFTVTNAAGTELWFARTESASAPELVTAHLTAVLWNGFEWMPDGERLVFLAEPAGLGPAPEAPRVPRGPVVQATSGERSPLRTYRDLLSSAYDEALFEHYASGTISIFDPRAAAGERVVAVGDPGLYASVQPSPDGTRLLVERIHRPYSYLMPHSRFPRAIDVWALDGSLVRRIVDLPLAEAIPIDGVRTGPRDVQWMAGAADTLAWVEALDDGDPEREVPHRDRWMAWTLPFHEPARELARVEHRATGISWTRDSGRFVVREYDRDRRWVRESLVALREGTAEVVPIVLEDRSARDLYGDPGAIVRRANPRGQFVLRQDGPWIYRVGEGASPTGPRPFLARQNLDTLETERIWQCTPGSYERVEALVVSGSERLPTFVTRYESPDEPPNYRLRDLESASSVTALTAYMDPAPELREVSKQLVTYERADGVQLSATLYLPQGYDPSSGGTLPLVVWAYPLEFTDADTAGQVRASPYRFTRFDGASHLYLVTLGYAVMDGATMPVIGDTKTMNDSFVEQIVLSAEAAIGKAVRMGVADPLRVGVGGHSYGAFMAVNLLAHSNLFRAGVASSGAYNRTLTPFGFQSERRTLWEAPDVYARVSPFFHADAIDEPLLLIHGSEDSNSGTHPFQSERMFQAIKGNGGTARLVMLPAEQHRYRARESVLHVLAETVGWFDKYLKVARSPVIEAAAPLQDTGAGR
jgi:dipeptidyl aminopeptidase/acylaminoacyl peptidase